MNVSILLDANILYSAPMRDLFMQMSVLDLFAAKWSNDIHAEWINNLLKNNLSLTREKLERTKELMNSKTRDAVIENYSSLIPKIKGMPDPGDRHVVAAAIVGGCNFIITKNLRDFPEVALIPHNIAAKHPDDFLFNVFESKPQIFVEAVRKVRARLKKPPLTASQYLAILHKQELRKTSEALMNYEYKL